MGNETPLIDIDGTQNRPIKLSELTPVTAASVGLLSKMGFFEDIEVTSLRTLEADAIKTLESFTNLSADGIYIQGSCDEVALPLKRATDAAATPEIPSLARVWPRDNTASVGSYCHALLFYGLGATDLPAFPSGEMLLKVLTDENIAARTFGETPFVRTRHGLRYEVGRSLEPGESHRDICLATFAALNIPLDSPIRLVSGSYSIADLLSESLANFDLRQKEPAWTTIAYAKYLPPKKEWTNRFGEHTSFSQLAGELLRLDLSRQSCGGTHILQALVQIDNADRRQRVLDAKTRKQLDSYLTAKLQQLVRRQQVDGGWTEQWCDSIPRRAPTTLFPLRLLISGHLAEVLTSLDYSRRPTNSVYLRAAEWLRQAASSPELQPGNDDICRFTHAARAARLILRYPRTNGWSFAETFHHAE